MVCKKEAEKEDMIPNVPFFSYWTELEKRKLGIRKKMNTRMPFDLCCQSPDETGRTSA